MAPVLIVLGHPTRATLILEDVSYVVTGLKRMLGADAIEDIGDKVRRSINAWTRSSHKATGGDDVSIAV